MPQPSAVAIEIHKAPRGRYRSTLRRADGVLIALEGGSYNVIGGAPRRVPHDLAHLVVEDTFRLPRGLWGVLAAGGLVQNATFAGGRRPPHAQKRATAVTDAAGESLRQAEVLVRAVADALLEGATRDVAALRARVGPRWWSPSITVEALAGACARLREEADAWDALPPDGTLTRIWAPVRIADRN